MTTHFNSKSDLNFERVVSVLPHLFDVSLRHVLDGCNTLKRSTSDDLSCGIK
jgi:hypothetical protein